MNLIANFQFELVHDGLYRDAAYSVGGLEFEQDRLSRADHCLHFLCIVHEQGLARMQSHPCGDQGAHDHRECEIIVPARAVGQKDQPGDESKPGGDEDVGILGKKRFHGV